MIVKIRIRGKSQWDSRTTGSGKDAAFNLAFMRLLSGQLKTKAAIEAAFSDSNIGPNHKVLHQFTEIWDDPDQPHGWTLDEATGIMSRPHEADPTKKVRFRIQSNTSTTGLTVAGLTISTMAKDEPDLTTFGMARQMVFYWTGGCRDLYVVVRKNLVMAYYVPHMSFTQLTYGLDSYPTMYMFYIPYGACAQSNLDDIGTSAPLIITPMETPTQGMGYRNGLIAAGQTTQWTFNNQAMVVITGARPASDNNVGMSIYGSIPAFYASPAPVYPSQIVHNAGKVGKSEHKPALVEVSINVCPSPYMSQAYYSMLNMIYPFSKETGIMVLADSDDYSSFIRNGRITFAGTEYLNVYTGGRYDGNMLVPFTEKKVA